MRNFLLPLVGLATLVAPASAQRASKAPEPYALTGVRLSSDADAPKYTLLLKGGHIEAVLPAAQEVSGEYRVLPADDLLAIPAFVDVFSYAGIEMPEPQATRDTPISTRGDVRIEMREANRKGIQPDWSAASAFSLSESDLEAKRKAGFGAMLSVPHGEILSGMSAAALLGDGAPRDMVLSDRVFGHAAFAARGNGYPTTLMGMHAQLRQFLMDSSWQSELRDRKEKGLAGPRPAYDPGLKAGAVLLSGEQRLICEAQSARDIRRWIRLADEFKLKIAIAGGREAWQLSEQLAAMDIPVILTLQWAKEVKDPDEKKEKSKKDKKGKKDKEGKEGKDKKSSKEADPFEYEEPLALQRERRRRWELQRDNGIRLQEAGVAVYFGSGSESCDELMSQARALVEAGYPRESLQRAMTADAANWLGLSNELGSLQPGSGANVCLWTADPFDEKAKVRFSFVDGHLKQWEAKVEEAPEADLSGTWQLTFAEGGMTGVFEFKMTEDGAVSGEARVVSEGEEEVVALEGQLSGNEFTLGGELDIEGMSVPINVTGSVEGDRLEATAATEHPVVSLEMTIKGERKPKGGKL
ncbi:MAG: hypothetical protein P1V35_06205 [Planctomycetota bacterium]|nr:hypothetical protein [Planctomycetota bacterium]